MNAGDQKISVERKRERCPYCHDEIVAGDVWICPGCEASQHAACRDEHKGCASCDWRGFTDAEVKEKTGQAALDPALSSRKKELERLGFEILKTTSDRLTAVLGRWHWDCFATKLVYTVFVRRLPLLSEEIYLADRVKLEEEAASLDASKLPRGFQKGNAVVVLYVADQVEPGAIKRIEEKPERGFARFHFPVVFDVSTGKGAYLKTTPTFGGIYYAKFRYLAARLLHPDARIAKEPLSRFGIALMAVMVLSMGVAGLGFLLALLSFLFL